MSNAWLIVSTLLAFIGTLVRTAATFPVSFPSIKRINPDATKRALNGELLGLPTTNLSSSVPSSLSAYSRYHISDTPIDLIFTFFGDPIPPGLVFREVERVIDEISANLSLHPTESMTHGSFEQHRDGLEINIFEYSGKQVTWFSLHQLLLGLEHFTSTYKNSRELEFEIDIAGKGRVGYGSLWYKAPPGLGLEERAIVETLQHYEVNSSHSSQNDSRHHLLLPTLLDEHVILSFHFFGQAIPESAVTNLVRRARQAIITNVRLYPGEDVPDGLFVFQLDGTRVNLVVKATVGKELTWLLLNEVLAKLAAHRWREHFLQEFDFDYEIPPFEETYGSGSVRYLPHNGSSSATTLGT